MSNRILPHLLTAALLTASLVACGEKKEPAPTPTPAAPVPADTQAAPSQPLVVKGANGQVSFEDSVYHDFSYEATIVPRRINDSILKANKSDPRKIAGAMTEFLHHQDTAARIFVAAKYGISVDSLNAILKKKEKE